MAFSFPFRFKSGFLCCFLCANEAIMVVLLVFELYIYLRYMHVTMAAKCCECSWKWDDSMNVWLSFRLFHCVAYEYDIQLLVSLNPPPPHPRIYVAMCKKKFVHLYLLLMNETRNK